MQGRRYKLYLASGIRLWMLNFKDKYSPFFNKKLDLFQPALIDNQYTGDHRTIPIRIATKDLGEINKVVMQNPKVCKIQRFNLCPKII